MRAGLITNFNEPVNQVSGEIYGKFFVVIKNFNYNFFVKPYSLGKVFKATICNTDTGFKRGAEVQITNTGQSFLPPTHAAHASCQVEDMARTRDNMTQLNFETVTTSPAMYVKLLS